MSKPRRIAQLCVVEKRWLAAGTHPACADAAKRSSDGPSIALAKADRQSSVAQSETRNPIAGCVPPISRAIARHRANGKSP